MARIKSKNTGFETKFFRILSAKIYPEGFRYRKHYKAIAGKPDIAFVRKKVAIFLDSDFWHGRNFRKLEPLLKNRYWINKIARNIVRDKRVNRELSHAGWVVMRFGESEIKKRPLAVVRRITARLRS